MKIIRVWGVTKLNPLIGFIQFKPITFTSYFFEGTYGFIREFLVADSYRNGGVQGENQFDMFIKRLKLVP